MAPLNKCFTLTYQVRSFSFFLSYIYTTFVEVVSKAYERFKIFLQVNAQKASFQAVRGITHSKLSTSLKRIGQLRLLGSGQKYYRLLMESDNSSTDSTETSEGSGGELPSDSSDIEVDATIVQSLEGNGKGQTISEKADVAVIEALEGKRVDSNEVQRTSIVAENGSGRTQVYPSGDLVYKEKEGWEKFVVQCRMLIALPWQRVKKGSVLTMKLSGEVS